MPMKKDPQGGGTNADGSKSGKYCSYCYVGGGFTADCTAEEMQQFCCDHMVKNMNMPKFLAKLFTRGIPKLERWAGN